MIGGSPFQDQIYLDPKWFNGAHQRWLDGQQSFHAQSWISQSWLEQIRYAVIAYRPDGRLRPLTAEIAATMYDEGDSIIDIYNLFEVDPKLGTDYVKKLISSTDDEGSGIEAARKLRAKGHTSNMIASRLGISARTVRHWLSDPH